jgi:hypothetical protein
MLGNIARLASGMPSTTVVRHEDLHFPNEPAAEDRAIADARPPPAHRAW